VIQEESPQTKALSVHAVFVDVHDQYVYRVEGTMKHATIMIWSLSALVLSLWQSGCQTHLPVTEQAYVEEVRFRGAWDYAIGRLSYNEVVKAWGAPTSVLSGGSPQGTELDSAPIRANWHWNHSIGLTPAISPEDGNPMFGHRMELVFAPGSKLLMDWKYWEWGPISRSYGHRL
jgi:hypothetical protein